MEVYSYTDHPRCHRRWQLQCFALQCLYCFCLFFLFFCFSNTISFTRDELLNIRQNTPQNLLQDFDYCLDATGRADGEASRGAREASSVQIKNAVA